MARRILAAGGRAGRPRRRAAPRSCCPPTTRAARGWRCPRVIGAHRRMTTPPAYSVARDTSVIRGYAKKHTQAHTRVTGAATGSSLLRERRLLPGPAATDATGNDDDDDVPVVDRETGRRGVTPREREHVLYIHTKARACARKSRRRC